MRGVGLLNWFYRHTDGLMPQTKVRSDDHGLYVRTGGYVFRPGIVSDLPADTMDMTDGGLVADVVIKNLDIFQVNWAL
jgi:hypothetical protein